MATAAAGHLATGSPPLRQLVADADWVVHARITDAHAAVVMERPPLRRPVVAALVLEALKGDAEPGLPLRFAQHAHGDPAFADGDEVVLFLRRIERSRELGATELARVLAWVSLQEHDARFELDAAQREPVLAAVRGYAALDALPPAARAAALRALTLRLAASPEPRLAAAGLRELIGAPALELDAAERALLEAVVADAARPASARAALLIALERAGPIDAGPLWSALLSGSTGAEQEAVIRAAGASADASVGETLLGLLRGPDARAAAAAALALGRPGADAAVAPLSAALAGGDARLQGGAIRALGRIATPAAQAALERAAAEHPDPRVRRRARAEAALLAR